MRKTLERNLDLRDKYHHEFKTVFGVSLHRYFNNLTGFDVVKFDEEFVKPKANKESMRDALKRRWGDDAVALVMNLIGSVDG